MIVPDVNVLLALARPDHVHHDRVRPWWSAQSDLAMVMTVLDLVWVGVVRIATNHRVFPEPSGLDEVVAFVEAVRAQPNCRDFPTQQSPVPLFLQECAQASAIANHVTDAYIAAAARSIGASVATFDRGFRRFDGLRIIEPA